MSNWPSHIVRRNHILPYLSIECMVKLVGIGKMPRKRENSPTNFAEF